MTERGVLHVNATSFGGGVAEILYTLVPLLRDVGLEAEWGVMFGAEPFFNVTKGFHNALQGADYELTVEAARSTRSTTASPRPRSSRPGRSGISCSSTTPSRHS